MSLSSLASARPSAVMPLLAAILAIAIFVVDTMTTLDIAVAVLYVAVILLAMDFAGRRGILIVAAACAGLTLLSYAIVHEEGEGGPILRCLVSLSAIAIAGLLAARHQGSVASLREHASLLDLTHDTVFVRDRNDVIVYWNRAAVELYGWSGEQALGRKAAELLQTEFPAPFESLMADLARDGRWEGELVHTCSDGRRVTVASRWAMRRDARGHPAAILETNNDVTGRRDMEEGLDRARSELAHVGRLATLGELTASIAHEVNQPLAAIVTNGEAGLRWLDREVPNLLQVRASLEHMIRNGQRASDVVRRLRALSRKVDPSYGPVSVAEVVADVALLIDRELLAHRVALLVQAAPDLPPVRGDRVQLQQVVMNLMLNGVQAMDAVTGRPRRLSVEIQRARASDEAPEGIASETASETGNQAGNEAGGVTFVVSDAGNGIDPAHLARLFDAFFTTRPEGMGMGLSICRSIVDAHGGRISASSRPGAGASFQVSLPAWQDGAP